MSQASLEKRVEALEKQVSTLLAAQTRHHRSKDWHSLIGIFTGDDVMKQIFKEGRKIREADRKRGRPKRTKKVRASA